MNFLLAFGIFFVNKTLETVPCELRYCLKIILII